MVITILMVAFGFLVYHKMDLHRRQLTQASIPSTAENGSPVGNSAEQLLTADAQSANQSEQPVTNDPLLSRTDLSDGSPFGISGMNLADASATSTSATEQIVASGDAAEDAEPDSHGTGDFATPIFAFSEPPELSGDPLGAGNSGESGAVAESSRLNHPQDNTNQSEAVPDTRLAMLEVTPESTADSDRGPTESHIPDVSFLQARSVATSAPQPEDAESRIAQDEFPPLFASTDPETPSLSDSTSPDVTTTEPTILAMAEPQQESGFSGGFIADDNGVSARNSIVSDVVESFPTLDSATTEPRQETLLAAQESTPFGSGFDAVTQPSSRSANRNSIKTAAGSGSDGKFSLAAFNYQNNSVEPAPDDGSTFDSTVVQDGDNYTKISKRIYGSGRYFSALAVFNQHRIPEPKKMRPGMVVLTPPVPVLEERYPQLFLDSKAKTVEPAAFLIMDDGSPAYRVGERETLSEISERFLGRSARWIEIYRLNQSMVKDPNKLKTGLILALPADATEVNVTP